ncbi:MAG: hypothetical protein AB8F95_13090 [Bacteroidia bacterium]
MQLHYLSEGNLRDRLFIQQYVHAFKPESKALVVVAPFGGTVRDTRFVTRRLSTLLSENLVHNNAFVAAQRSMVKRDENGGLTVRTDFVKKLVDPLQLLILGAVVEGVSEEELVEGEALVGALREVLPVSEVLVFPHNPMSPLSNKSIAVKEHSDIADLLAAYEEEHEALECALRLAPVRFTGPQAIMK